MQNKSYISTISLLVFALEIHNLVTANGGISFRGENICIFFADPGIAMDCLTNTIVIKYLGDTTIQFPLDHYFYQTNAKPGAALQTKT